MSDALLFPGLRMLEAVNPGMELGLVMNFETDDMDLLIRRRGAPWQRVPFLQKQELEDGSYRETCQGRVEGAIRDYADYSLGVVSLPQPDVSQPLAYTVASR